VSLLHKFGFQPTKPGKYRFEERRRLAQRGLAGGKFTAGGRAQFVFQRMLVKAAEDGTTGEVTSEDQQNDAVYLSPVQIGTPAQTLMLDCDTGSADLWVFSTGMPAETQRGHTTYDASLSSSWKDMPRYSWKVKYADESSASGSCGTDTVGLGGLQVTGQVIELAQQASMTLVSRSGDGMLGLGFSTINTVIKDGDHDPQATAVDNMITQKDIPADARLFTSCLYSDRDAGKQSFFTFGWIDQDLVSASGKDIVCELTMCGP
jgi:hypothetical protein